MGVPGDDIVWAGRQLEGSRMRARVNRWRASAMRWSSSISANTAAVPRVAMTGAKGVVTFSDVPSGSLQLIAHGEDS